MTRQQADIYKQVGKRIRELRTTVEGGISQEELAMAMNTTANTISRWETGIYKPSMSDLEKLSSFFDEPIATFFAEIAVSSQISGLLNAIQGLDDKNIKEVTLYALFRRAHQGKK